MSLEEKYVDRVSNYLSARAAWGSEQALSLGDVLIKKNGNYAVYHTLPHFTDAATTTTKLMDGLNIISSGTKRTIVQGAVGVPGVDLLNPQQEAALHYDFAEKHQFALRTSKLRHSYIDNLQDVVRVLHAHENWDHDEYYLVRQVYKAGHYFFAGTEAGSGSTELSGAVAAIAKFIGFGVRAGLQISSSQAVEAVDRNVTIAFGLVRIEDDGDPELVP